MVYVCSCKKRKSYTFLFAQRLGSKGFMTKAELQREAQPLCDKSLTMVNDRIGFSYTPNHILEC